MQQFVFVGSVGSFPVPPGESRIGSDAACQICIHGEGILPVHAYLQMDGEKVLIRPADSGHAGGHAGAAISINGKRLSGPVSIVGGQDVSIGNIQMRLLSNGVKKRGLDLWGRRWFRGLTYSLSGIAAVVLLIFSYVYFVILDENALKLRIKNAIATHFLRDDTEIESIQVKLFEGAINLNNIKIQDRHNFPNAEGDFTTIQSVAFNLRLWPFIKSGFRDFNDVHIVVTKPEINLERAQADGTFNIQDIIAKISQNHAPRDLGMNKLDFTLEVKDGRVKLNDDFTKIGKTSLDNINIVLHEPAAGEPIVIKTCEMKVTTPDAQGSLKLTGKMNAIDYACTIDSTKLSSDDMHVTLTNVDLARIFEHFGYAWEPYAQNFRVVLGKPISGLVNLKIQDLKHLHFDGQVASDSLISIREESGPPLGNIPMGLHADVLLVDSGRGYRPQEIDLKLLSGAQRSDLNNPETTYLDFETKGKLNPGGVSVFTVGLNCALKELCGTDVGRRLGLEGRLGGRLEGAATLLLDANGCLQIDARMKGEDSYVMVSESQDPAYKEKPYIPKKAPVRQPLPLSFNCHANATPGPSGGLSDIVIESFSLTAPSFVAKSELQGMISGLGHDGGDLEAQARFNLNLKGREFWTEFAPILALFGFTKPVEEILDLQILVWGKKNTIRVGARGKASRQWGPDRAPVKLDSIIQYNARQANMHRAGNTEPFTSLILEVASDEGKPLYVRVEGQCSQNDKSQTVTLVSYDKDDKEHKTPLPGLKIKSDVVTLRERFKPYIEGYLESCDEAHNRTENGWLKLYSNTRLSGELEESGRVTLQRMNDSKSAEPDRMNFDLKVAGTDLEIQTPIKAVAPRNPLRQQYWTWREDSVEIGMKGNYEQRLSDSREEPDKERLNVDRLDVKGSLGSFVLGVNNLDVFKIANLRSLPKLTWTDCLSSLTMSGQLNPPAYEFGRSLNLIPEENPISGTLALQILFDQSKDTLDLQKFVFKQTDAKRRFFLTNLDVSGSLLRVHNLSSRFLPAQADGVPLSERIANYVDQGGPAALLDHLGDNLAINSLQIDTASFIELVKKDFGGDTRKVPSVLAGLLKNDWRPEGTWQAAGIKFCRVDDQKNRKWELVGALRNDFTCFGSETQANDARPVVFSFRNRWSLGMGIAVSVTDNTIALKGDAFFDQAAVNGSLPALNYEYKKPAGDACKVELECLYAHGLLTHISKLKLTGKPLSFEVKDFEAAIHPPDKRTYTLAELGIDQGPLPCLLTVHKLDPSADAVNMQLLVPVLDLQYMSSIPDLRPPDAISLSGTLKNVNVAYKGSLATLQTFMEASSALAAQFPKADPAEAHAKAINSEGDTLEFDALLDGVKIIASARKDQMARMNLGGTVHLTPRDLTWKNLSADIDLVTSGSGGVKQAFTVPQLNVSSTDANLNLMRALRAPGMPLNIGANPTFSTPLNAPAMFSIHNAVMTALGALSPAGEQGEMKFRSMEQLVASGSLKAPMIVSGERKLEIVGAQNFTLKALQFSVPNLTTELFGGRLVLSDADFDLTKASMIPKNGTFNTRGVGFKFRGNLNDGNLALILGGADPGKNGYFVNGRIDADGGIHGEDFGSDDRLHWDGAIRFKLSNLVCITPPHHGGVIEEPIAPWSASLAGLNPKIYAAMMKAANSETVSIADLSRDLPVEEPRKPLNGLLLAAQVYLAKTYGIEYSRFEFDSLSPTMNIEGGWAEIREPLRLSGRGSCEGLGIQIDHFKINLADETFADASVYPFAVPKQAETRMHLDKWGSGLRNDFLRAMADGKLPLRINGRLGAPVTTYAWPELKRWGRLALFNTEKIDDMETLSKARTWLLTNWGNTPPDLDAAASLADRAGVGLPGTLTARQQGETVLDRVPGLPRRLIGRLSNNGPTISPMESLREILQEPLDTVQPPPVTPPPPPVPPPSPRPPVNPIAPAPATPQAPQNAQTPPGK